MIFTTKTYIEKNIHKVLKTVKITLIAHFVYFFKVFSKCSVCWFGFSIILNTNIFMDGALQKTFYPKNVSKCNMTQEKFWACHTLFIKIQIFNKL